MFHVLTARGAPSAASARQIYAQYAVENPQLMRVVGVAEPSEFRRQNMAAKHGIPAERCFTTWEAAAALPRFADAVVIGTQDAMHAGPATAFARLGYHILLEKPMASTREDCEAIAVAASEAGIMLAVAHVLRYTPYMAAMKALLRDGAVGDIVSVQHLEPVGHWHFAHSYVRGAWRRKSEGSSFLMAKACHDVDLIRYIVDQPCTSVSSVGSLFHFRPDKAPAGAGKRCLECAVEDSCPYSAKRLYLDPLRDGHTGWPVSVLVDAMPDVENVTEALKTGPYGRCVYSSDNDVVDNQVVAMQFEGGATASLSVVAFTEAMCVRRTRVFGTHGELDGNGEDGILYTDFRSGRRQEVKVAPLAESTMLRGHGGADYHLIRSFCRAVATGDASHILSGPADTLESHLIVFAAEDARESGSVVKIAPVAEVVAAASSSVDSPKARAAVPAGAAGGAPKTIATAAGDSDM